MTNEFWLHDMFYILYLCYVQSVLYLGLAALSAFPSGICLFLQLFNPGFGAPCLCMEAFQLLGEGILDLTFLQSVFSGL